MKLVPEGAQNLCEWLVEGLRTFLEGIVGLDLLFNGWSWVMLALAARKIPNVTS